MTIGDGLFLSSLFLGVVLLYIFTRDRWSWKKIVVRSIAVVFGLVLVIGFGTYAYVQYENRPQIATSLWNVAIGASPSDVKFAKGEPTEIDNEVSTKPRWVYKTEHVTYFVEFKEDKVARVMAVGERLYLPSVGGVSAYASFEEISDKLGPPSYISRQKDELQRTYSFSKYNVAFGIERGEIQMIAVGVSEASPVRFSNEATP